MLEEIYPLAVYATPGEIITKINELCAATNELTAKDRAIAERVAKHAERVAKYGDLAPVQIDAMRRVEAGEATPDQIAAEWTVSFYDDVEHALTSPVYCSRCLFRSQSLLDRMLAPKDPTKCEGCIHKMKHG